MQGVELWKRSLFVFFWLMAKGTPRKMECERKNTTISRNQQNTCLLAFGLWRQGGCTSKLFEGSSLDSVLDLQGAQVSKHSGGTKTLSNVNHRSTTENQAAVLSILHPFINHQSSFISSPCEVSRCSKKTLFEP